MNITPEDNKRISDAFKGADVLTHGIGLAVQVAYDCGYNRGMRESGDGKILFKLDKIIERLNPPQSVCKNCSCYYNPLASGIAHILKPPQTYCRDNNCRCHT